MTTTTPTTTTTTTTEAEGQMAENTKLITDDEALALVRLRDIRALVDAIPNAAVHTAEGRRWDSVRLKNWAKAIGSVALAFAPTTTSTSTTTPSTKRGSGGRR